MYLYDNLLMVDVPSGYYGMLVIIIFVKKQAIIQGIVFRKNTTIFYYWNLCKW